MKYFVLIICLVVNFSCSSNTSKETKTETKSKGAKDLKETKIVDDEFINEFMNSLDYQKLTKIKHSVSNKLEDNPLYSEKKDTLIDLDIKQNSFRYYKAFGKIMITDAKIKTPDIELCSDRIHTGDSKEIFKKKFNLKSIYDKLIISDTEERITCEFIFSNELLTEISYSATMD